MISANTTRYLPVCSIKRTRSPLKFSRIHHTQHATVTTMFDAFYRARNFINNTFKPQELDEDGAAATVPDRKSNSVDEDDRKPPAKEVQKELRRSPRVTNSWRIGYNEESDSDEDVEGEGGERNLISTSKADSEGVLHDVTDETYDLDDNPGRQKGRNDGERTPHFADETYDVVDSNSGIKWDQSKYLDESWEKKYQQLVQYKVWLCDLMTDLHDVYLINHLLVLLGQKERTWALQCPILDT